MGNNIFLAVDANTLPDAIVAVSAEPNLLQLFFSLSYSTKAMLKPTAVALNIPAAVEHPIAQGIVEPKLQKAPAQKPAAAIAEAAAKLAIVTFAIFNFETSSLFFWYDDNFSI